LLIKVQVAHAPRTETLAIPYFSNFFCQLN
jgi:hypothetical protein